TELAFHRLLFFADSPDTPWPSNPGEYTAFAVEFSAAAIDLTQPPLNIDEAIWTHRTDYAPCQALADLCRSIDVDVIKYRSARYPTPAMNIAILRCRAFAHPDIVDRQTWRIHLSDTGARVICELPKEVLDFDRESFASDPRIAAMRWRR